MNPGLPPWATNGSPSGAKAVVTTRRGAAGVRCPGREPWVFGVSQPRVPYIPAPAALRALR